MRELETNLLDWQKRYGTEEACAQALTQQRWPEGFRCPRCGMHWSTVPGRQRSITFQARRSREEAVFGTGRAARVACRWVWWWLRYCAPKGARCGTPVNTGKP